MSTTQKFSGPWHVVNDSQGFDNIHHAPAGDGDTGDIVATCYQDSDHAHLIAAAPDMFDALARAMKWLAISDDVRCEKDFKAAEAALAKARGEA